ncbi:hypothetical protein IFR05_003189 [Cadophora sp. M221]|nr:hypothetical protein IFR05_003189 [Cadophora sp. M221]
MASSVDAKLLKSTKFPPEFNKKVDMQKVNAEVMKKWIAGKISEILGSEDDVVIELCFNLIEGTRFPDIKTMQIQLTGFLDKDTAGFCKELWNLCLSAQSNPQGVPKELLEAKKLELIQEKRSRALVETKTNAGKGKLTTSATENVVNEATVGIGETEETEDVVEDVEIHGEEVEEIETSIAEGVVEVEVDVGRDETTVVAHLPPNLGLHLLPDLNRRLAHLLADVPAPYPAPVLLLGDDPGHLTGGITIVLVEPEVVEVVGTVESVAGHQVQTHLVLGPQGPADAEDPPLFLHLHPLHQGPGTPVAIAALAPDPYLPHAVVLHLRVVAEVDLEVPVVVDETESVVVPYNAMSQQARGGGTPHPILKEIERLIQMKRKTGDHHEEKRARVLVRSSRPTRLVALRNLNPEVNLPLRALYIFAFSQADISDGTQMRDPRRQANELREKLLRERIKKMRTLSTNSVNAQANAS